MRRRRRGAAAGALDARAVGQDPRGEVGQQAHQAGGVQVADGHPRRALRQRVAAQRQDGADPHRGGAERVGRQGDAVAIAAGHLQDRLGPGRHGDRRGRERGHAGAGAGQVGDVQPVGKRERRHGALDGRGVGAARRDELGGDHERARLQARGEPRHRRRHAASTRAGRPCRGRSVNRASMCGGAGSGTTRQVRPMAASTSVPSSIANRSPMHIRDPAANGK